MASSRRRARSDDRRHAVSGLQSFLDGHDLRRPNVSELDLGNADVGKLHRVGGLVCIDLLSTGNLQLHQHLCVSVLWRRPTPRNRAVDVARGVDCAAVHTLFARLHSCGFHDL